MKALELKSKSRGFYVAVRPNRILRLQSEKKRIEKRVFTEKDIKGLSKCEKEFLIENGMKATCGDFYMFIEKNKSTGRKQLYAYHKEQSLFPNDYKGNRFNYECWLTFDRVRCTFSKLEYEVRFCQSPHERVILFN